MTVANVSLDFGYFYCFFSMFFSLAYFTLILTPLSRFFRVSMDFVIDAIVSLFKIDRLFKHTTELGVTLRSASE